MVATTNTSVTALVAALRAGDRRSLARTLSVLESEGQPVERLCRAMQAHLNGVGVVGFTGPPGAGKSTLVNALIKHWRDANKRIGVIAVDPSSPVSGGAILGDRVRMSAALDDEGVFVRSLASRGHLGGLTPGAARAIDAFDVAGYDLVLLETVGTGQNEIDIASVADVGVVIAAPGLGDGVQAMKSGLLEVADILVVNKSDRADAAETAQQLHAAVSLRHGLGRSPPVVSTTAVTGLGVAELGTCIDGELGRVLRDVAPSERRLKRGRYIVERSAIGALQRALRDDHEVEVRALIGDVLSGRLTSGEAAARLLARSGLR